MNEKSYMDTKLSKAKNKKDTRQRVGRRMIRHTALVAMLFSSLAVMAQGPKVGGAVFGGGRMANVTGTTEVTVN